MKVCPQCSVESGDDQAYCGGCGMRLTQSDADPTAVLANRRRPSGTVVGTYRILDTLGEGGMGFVYLAEHTRLGRKVAIKMLRGEYSTNPVAVKRFFAEARAVNKISHPNIVEIYDFVENEGGDNYYIMELLKGEALIDILARDGFLPAGRAIVIASQVVSAMVAVHEAGVIHRDLKPDNVFLIERNGIPDFVKLLDFGVAKLVDGDNIVNMAKTAAGAIMGTPEYMSPEQAASKPIDVRSDIYSLGVMLYELVTGIRPFEAASFGEMVVKHMIITPTTPNKIKDRPQEVPEKLEALIMACLAKDPVDRPQTMREVEERLLPLLDGIPLPDTSIASRVSGRFNAVGPSAVSTSGRFNVLTPSGRMQAITGSGKHTATPPPGMTSGGYQIVPPKRHLSPVLLAVAGVILVGGVAGVVLATRGKSPSAPAQVALLLESTPPGAEVRHDGAVLGKTPLELKVPRGEHATYEFVLDGHRPERQEIDLSRDARIAVSLAALPAPPPPVVVAAPPPTTTEPAKPTTTKVKSGTSRPPKKKPPIDKSDVVDPFDI